MDLTIVIPTRNRNTRIQECVHALEHNEADIVVVDDAADEPVVVSAASARVIRHDRRRGRGAAINTGLKAALHEPVLILDDDIYAAPDMIVRMLEEFYNRNNPKVALAPKIVWDPDVPLTLTMRWMERVQKFPSPMLVSRSYILQNGGYDENFTRRFEDTELQLRLRKDGFELIHLDSAVGFQNNLFEVRDLIEREFTEGMCAVFLDAKFPGFIPQLDDIDKLLKNENQASDAACAVDEIVLMEQSGPLEIPAGVPDLYAHVCRHYFLHGVFEALKDMGAVKQRRNSSSTVAIYRHASHLEEIGELDEARRLFRLVLHRSDEQHWDGAEYHLGSIEMALGNPEAAHTHFSECLRLNPAHNKARRALYKPAHFREVEANVFERLEIVATTKVLFVLFGELGHVVNAFPVVQALKVKFNSALAWLTAPEYAALAEASAADEVHETKSRGALPWDWVHEQGFTHIFFPEPGANIEELERSGLHPAEFIATKCRVTVERRRPHIVPSSDAIFEAEEFLREHDIQRNTFITAWTGDSQGRHWPNSNLMKVAQQTNMPVVVFGKKSDPEIPNTIACHDKPLDVINVLIRSCAFYLGPAYGTSWLATATDTPMAVFFDPHERNDHGCFRDLLRGEKNNIGEWSIYTNVRTVLDHLESTLLLPQ
jgi:tetratricopeptide (TPR) repeat protein